MSHCSRHVTIHSHMTNKIVIDTYKLLQIVKKLDTANVCNFWLKHE